jgi:hypothetical protein
MLVLFVFSFIGCVSKPHVDVSFQENSLRARVLESFRYSLERDLRETPPTIAGDFFIGIPTPIYELLAASDYCDPSDQNEDISRAFAAVTFLVDAPGGIDIFEAVWWTEQRASVFLFGGFCLAIVNGPALRMLLESGGVRVLTIPAAPDDAYPQPH